MKVKVTADSTCDLSPELVAEFDIGIIPLYIIQAGKAKRDGIEITPDDIYAHVTAGGEPSSTAAVNVDDYLRFFSKFLKEYDAIIHFTISSSMSTCYQNSCLAAQELGNVYTVDAQNLSSGIGHLVLDAAILAQEGMAAADIKAIMDEKKQKLDVSFCLDTLEYMRKGGRCSMVMALGANLLNIKPCIEVQKGKMGVGKKYRGSIQKVLLRYVDERLEDPDTIDSSRIFITDSGIAPEIRQSIEEAVLAKIPFRQVYHTQAGCTVSSHCGPNTLGILFYRK